MRWTEVNMISDIQVELSRFDTSQKTLRNFGLLFCAVFGFWAGALFWKGSLNALWPAAVSVGFLLAGLFSPSALRRLFLLWMSLAAVMGWFMTRLILLTAFTILIAPLGLLLRLMGKDLLNEKHDRDAATYWKKHEPVGDRGQYRKQF
jgi:hypothetical protein